MDDIELRAELTALREEVERLKADRVREQPVQIMPDTAVTRRGWMKAAAAAAVGGTALALSDAIPAAAANGDNLVIGNHGVATGRQVATSPTQLDYTGTEDIGFVVQSGTSFSATSSTFDAALAGWTNRSNHPNGVYGFAGATTGSNSSGVLGRTQATNSAGVRARGDGTNSDGVYATSGSSGAGVRASGGRGVLADGSSVGVEANGPSAVVANGTVYGLESRGSRAPIHLPPATGASAPDLADTHAPGELRTNQVTGATDGELWLCVEGGTPGLWRKLGSPGSAGVLHPVEPFRAYDSRTPAPFRQVLTVPDTRTVSVADARDLTSGAVTVADVVPVGATAVAYNLAITGTTGGGFLALAPGGATTLGAASINWAASGVTVANAGIIKLGINRDLVVFSGGSGGTEFIIDITGYWQ